MALTDLLNEMEETAFEINGIYRSAGLIEAYIEQNKGIEEIQNMSYMITTFKNTLLCLQKKIEQIIKSKKYNEPDFWDKQIETLNSNAFIFDE